MDRTKYQYEGMKWFVELELLNHPQVINTLKLNIFMASKSIKEAELLIYRENKAMLVLLELSWFGRTFNKRRIFEDVQESLSQLLPSFRFRITDDPRIMGLAVAKVKQALTGGKNENVSNTSGNVNGQSNSGQSVQSSSGENSTGSTESDQSDSEKQSGSTEEVRPDSGTNDRKEEQ